MKGLYMFYIFKILIIITSILWSLYFIMLIYQSEESFLFNANKNKSNGIGCIILFIGVVVFCFSFGLLMRVPQPYAYFFSIFSITSQALQLLIRQLKINYKAKHNNQEINEKIKKQEQFAKKAMCPKCKATSCKLQSINRIDLLKSKQRVSLQCQSCKYIWEEPYFELDLKNTKNNTCKSFPYWWFVDRLIVAGILLTIYCFYYVN